MPLTPEEISDYAKNGYIILERLFTSKEIEEIKKITSDMATQIQKEVKTDKEDNRYDFKGASVAFKINSALKWNIKLVSWAGAAESKLVHYGRLSKLLHPTSQLLQSDEADHLINQIHYKLPGDGVSFPWHQDEQNRRRFDPEWTDVKGNGSFVQSLMAVDEATEENGPLYVIPGSHQWGYLGFDKFLETNELDCKLAEKNITSKKERIPLLLKPGDVVFMHPHLVHASWPNNSTQPRRMLINGFSFPGANHKPYPGIGSAKRISLKTGQEYKEDKSFEAILPFPEVSKTNKQIHLILKKRGLFGLDTDRKLSFKDACTLTRREYQEKYQKLYRMGK